jgi:hypothetical protein
MPWKCFVVSPTDRAYRSLRRYAGGKKCPAYQKGNRLDYHNAEVLIGETEMPGIWMGQTEQHYSEDPRWPAECACGYRFRPNDPYQCNLERIFEGVRDPHAGFLVRGTTCHGPSALPPGAMFALERTTELAKAFARGEPGPDGKYWFLMLPGHTIWEVYGPSSRGKDETWDVTGTPPVIRVNPSLNYPNVYHGWVGQNGVDFGWITDDIEGRQFKKNGQRLVD